VPRLFIHVAPNARRRGSIPTYWGKSPHRRAPWQSVQKSGILHKVLDIAISTAYVVHIIRAKWRLKCRGMDMPG
jgi:hypothetical protein